MIFVFLFASLLFSNQVIAACEPIEKQVKGALTTVKFTERAPAIESHEVVIVVPPTGGTNLIDRSYASGLCAKGILAVTLDRWSDDDEYNLELEVHTRFYRRAQAAIELLMDQYKDKFFGLLGTSVGALHGSIAFARHDRIRSAFLIVGGGDIASIIAHSDQAAMVNARKSRFERYGFASDHDYVSALRKVVPFEPLNIKFERAKKRLGMVISTNDTTVPASNQYLLRDHWRPDTEYTIKWWHVLAIVKTWLFDRDKVVGFFKPH